MIVEPKPFPPVDILTSDAAADAYDIELETWANQGWAKVARICRWAVATVGSKAACPIAR